MTKKKKIIIGVVVGVLTLLLIAGIIIYKITFGQIEHDELTDTQVGINEDIDPSTLLEQEGYRNIAIFGLDNRKDGQLERGNSDTMMIVSINNETKDVKLVSIYRDTYFKVDEDKYAKANSAYAKGGPAQAVAMLNTNLDLTITDYISVDWSAVVTTIDALGGIDVKITENERKELNKHKEVVEEMMGRKSPDVTTTGLVHLDGIQSLTYARIRKHCGDDYKRSSRQRIVLQMMFEKAKENPEDLIANIPTILASANIKTTLSESYMMALAMNVSAFNIKETTGFPFENNVKKFQGKGEVVVPIELDNNVMELHKFLFEGENYMLSDTVQTISDNIAYETGYYEGAETVDTSNFNDTAGKNGTE